MIVSIFHPGSGIGNQLHRYVAGRVLAKDKGYKWGTFTSGNCKVKSFMNIDFGSQINGRYTLEGSGKVTPEINLPIWEEKTNYYNPEFNFIEDNTIVDGEFQDIRYFGHRLNDIREWLDVEILDMPDDLCVINFRGGEYKYFPELFLSREYWAEAIVLMLQKNINMRFQVHTDDKEEAKKFFPDYEIIQETSLNWRSIRFAKYLILSNSSFAILPALLNQNLKAKPIAPRYWARRNKKEWSMPQNYYPQFQYI